GVAYLAGQQIVVKVIQRFGDQTHRRIGLAQRLDLRRAKAQDAARLACLESALFDAQALLAALGLQLAVNHASARQPLGGVGLKQRWQLQAPQMSIEALPVRTQIGCARIQPEPAVHHLGFGGGPVEATMLQLLNIGVVFTLHQQRPEAEPGVGLLHLQFRYFQAQAIALQAKLQFGLQTAYFRAVEDAEIGRA